MTQFITFVAVCILLNACTTQNRTPIELKECVVSMPYGIVLDSAWQINQKAYIYMHDMDELSSVYFEEEAFFFLLNSGCLVLDKSVDTVYISVGQRNNSASWEYSSSELNLFLPFRKNASVYMNLLSRNMHRREFRISLSMLEHIYGYYMASDPSESKIYQANALGFLLEYAIEVGSGNRDQPFKALILEKMISEVEFDKVLQQDLTGFRAKFIP